MFAHKSLHFSKAFSKRFLRFAAWTFGVTFLAISAFLIRLSVKPLDLKPYQPWIKSQLNFFIAPYHIDFQQATLTWKPSSEGLVINLTKASLSDTSKHLQKAHIPSLFLDFELKDLLLGKTFPKRLILEKPVLAYVQTPEQDSAQKPQDLSSALAPFMHLKRIKIQDAKLLVIAGKNKWKFDSFSLITKRRKHKVWAKIDGKLDVCDLKAEATLLLPQDHPKKLSVYAKMKNLRFENLGKVWPEQLAQAPRNWIIDHIPKGLATSADFQSTLYLKDHGIEIEKLGGHINLKDMTCAYYRGLPEGKNINAQAKYDQNAFQITVFSGESEGIKVKRGNVHISKLQEELPQIDVDLDVQSSLQDSLAFLNNKELDLLSHFELSPTSLTGQTESHVTLSFPTHTQLQLSDIKISTTAKVTNIRSTKDFTFLPSKYPVSAEQLKVHVTNEGLKTTGPIKLGDLKADLTWDESFLEQQNRSFHLESTVTEDDLKSLDLPEFFKGAGQIDLKLTSAKDKPFSYELAADLTQADVNLPFFGKISAPAKPCHLKAAGLLQDDLVHALEKATLTGENLNARLQKTKDGLAAKNAQLGSSKFDLNLKTRPNALEIQLTGDHVKFDLDAPTPKSNGTSRTLMKLDVKDCELTGRTSIKNLKAIVDLNHGFLDQLDLKGIFKINDTPLRLKKTAKRQFEYSTKDAVETCKLLKVPGGVQRGKTSITFKQLENKDFTGTFKVKDFSVESASTIAKLVNLATPFGLFDAMSGKHITIDKLTCHFLKEHDGPIILKEGHAHGKSLGFTFSGFVQDSQIKLYGSLMPVNFINQAISKIPVLGKFAGDGIFGINYKIKGNPDDPKIKVYPLSMLAPGLFRKVLSEQAWEKSEKTKRKG